MGAGHVVVLVVAMTMAAPSWLAAQGAASGTPASAAWPPAIADNSFLIEEAYNQEAGVVQFIVNAVRARPDGDWLMSFTNEWPVPGMQHQFSYAVPYAALSGGRADGLGDVQLNYRYQALEESRHGIAFAPRFSISLPTGAAARGLGMGVTGYQIGLPLSKRLASHVAGHINLGATLWPGANVGRTEQGARTRDVGAFTQGGSAIWLVSPVFNAFLEIVASQVQVTGEGGPTRWSHQLLLNPGVRAAVNTAAGQLVLGASTPIGVTADSPDPSLFIYLSWEMAVWHPR